MSWRKMKLKHLAHMQSGNSITSESIDVEGEYPVYGGGALRGYTDNYTHDGGYILIGRQGANCGSVKEVKGKFFASEHAVVVTPNKKVDNGWLYYLLESMNLNQYSISAAQPGLAVSSIKNLEVTSPSYEIQVKTRQYIDKRTKMFENIIAQKEKLINLLEQQHQSIITEAVTKGINSNMKMKDSGVEWIGEIPEHWNLKKIKYTSYVKGRIGWQGLKAEEFQEEGPYLVTGTDFKNGTIDWEKCYRISEERYNQAPEIQLKEGDLLITKDGTIGKLALIENLPGPTSLNSHLLVIRPLKNDFNNEYLYWYLKSKVFLEYVEHTKTGTTFYGISQESIEKFSFACPNINEQNEISLYLKERIQQIEELINENKIVIQKLNEYRKSLIYEAVTGKIDVRDMELD